PHIQWGEVKVKKQGNGLWRIDAAVLNDRAIPTMTAVAIQNKLHRDDIASVNGAKVISSGIVNDPYLNKVDVQEHRPERLMVEGVDGLTTRHLFFLVQGDGDVTLTYDSLKGGKITKALTLK